MEATAQAKEEDLFFLESDHLALKGNQDYSEVLKTLFTLTAARKKAVEDYNTVVRLKKELLEDPLETLDKLTKGEDLGIPPVISLPEIPKIDFSKYKVKIPEDALEQVYSQKAYVEASTSDDLTKKKHIPSKNTHNTPWSHEEQKRLEELLITFPPEAIEANRFRKIAAALGNRTTKQVTSRVQKYFLQLYQKGFAIPGRIPKSGKYKYTKKSLHRHQRHNHYLWKQSTFFPDLCPPVNMEEGPDNATAVPMPSGGDYFTPRNRPGPGPSATVVKPEDDRLLKLGLIQRLKEEKQKESEDFSAAHVHAGYRCDYCNEKPITGTRWHCEDCKADSIDFCTDCALAQVLSEEPHPVSHNLVICRGDGGHYGGGGSSYSDQGSGLDDTDDSIKDYESSDDSGSERSFDMKTAGLDDFDISNVKLECL